jgi:hypothetical protein
MGLHSYVRAHPADERYEGPDQQVCRLCGKGRDVVGHPTGRPDRGRSGLGPPVSP